MCHGSVLKSHYERSPENSCKVEMHNKKWAFLYANNELAKKLRKNSIHYNFKETEIPRR